MSPRARKQNVTDAPTEIEERPDPPKSKKPAPKPDPKPAAKKGDPKLNKPNDSAFGRRI